MLEVQGANPDTIFFPVDYYLEVQTDINTFINTCKLQQFKCGEAEVHRVMKVGIFTWWGSRRPGMPLGEVILVRRFEG